MLKWFKRIIGKLNVRILFPENKELFEKYKNADLCYVFGTAETINKLDLSKLDKGAVKITVGNFYEHKDINIIKPSIHVFAASHPPITSEVLINWWKRCQLLLPKSTLLLIEYRDREIARKVFKGRKIYFYSYGGNYPLNFTKKIPSPASVSVLAVALAIYLRCTNINILGIEHEWRHKKTYSHFYNHDKPSLEFYLRKIGVFPHIKKEKTQRKLKESLYRYYNLYQQHEKLKKYASGKGIMIYNIDPNSHFDVYEQRPLII